jgi:dihydroorotate dehydrogenase electron transfer subunit
MISSITLLAQSAIEQELAVTLVAHFSNAAEVYPPVLLPPEVEYHIITADGSLGEQGEVQGALGDYLVWADAACCSVSRETAVALYATFERMRGRNFAQALVLRPLVCASGVCLSCSFETLSGVKMICRDGPVFDLREVARSATI